MVFLVNFNPWNPVLSLSALVPWYALGALVPCVYLGWCPVRHKMVVFT